MRKNIVNLTGKTVTIIDRSCVSKTKTGYRLKDDTKYKCIVYPSDGFANPVYEQIKIKDLESKNFSIPLYDVCISHIEGMPCVDENTYCIVSSSVPAAYTELGFKTGDLIIPHIEVLNSKNEVVGYLGFMLPYCY